MHGMMETYIIVKSWKQNTSK